MQTLQQIMFLAIYYFVVNIVVAEDEFAFMRRVVKRDCILRAKLVIT